MTSPWKWIFDRPDFMISFNVLFYCHHFVLISELNVSIASCWRFSISISMTLEAGYSAIWQFPARALWVDSITVNITISISSYVRCYWYRHCYFHYFIIISVIIITCDGLLLHGCHFMNQCRHIVQWTFWTDSMKVYTISHLLPICDMWWLVTLWVLSHFMNQCRHIVQWTFLNKLYEHIWYEPFIANVWHSQGLHWGLLPFKFVKIDTCDGFSPDRWQAITWTTADLFFIETFWTDPGFTLLKHDYCDLLHS